MNKIKISSYIQRTKWIVLILIAIVLVAFARTVDTPSLTKTAIVIGIGVDYLFETSDFEVTAQTVLAGSSSGETTQTTYNTYTGTGKTVAGALDDISRKIGLKVSLSHCNVLFVSKDALLLDHMQLLYPLLVMYELPEQAIIVSGNKSPREMIAVRIGTTVSAPYFLQSALINQEGSTGMIRTTAKDFLARSLSRSASAVIPYITAQKLQDQPMNETDTLKDNYFFDFSHALAFGRSKSVVLNGEMTELLALYFSKDVAGVLNYTAENGDTIEFKILKKDLSIKADKRKITSTLKVAVDLLDIQHVQADGVLSGADEIVVQFANDLAKQMENLLREMFELSKECGIDFLNLQAKAYQSVGRDLVENCLDTLEFEPIVSLSVEEAA